MALVELIRRGNLKHIISQNTDGLHRKSGVDAENISEVHGNTNLEICKKCGQNYMRDFRVRTAQKVHEHKTGRKCDNSNCNGDLYDTIINFGENLKEEVLDMAYAHGQEADLMLALGSSLRVNPAAHMASICTEK
jgi:NAD-dependent SIR2 family protein deacetylase